MSTLTLLQKRDFDLMLFLWRWKLVTCSGLSQVFFPKQAPVTAYGRLLRLKQGGWVTVRLDEKSGMYGWTLTKKGFLAIRDQLPGLKEEGFASEHVRHDLITSAFHLGEWLLEVPKNVHRFSEQQLRRLSSEFYPAWVPQSEEHRPDGYFGFKNESATQVMALEVELHRKGSDHYEGLGEFYGNLLSVVRVLWLVPSQGMARRIQLRISESLSRRTNIHNFVLVSDFLTQGWQAKMVVGPESGKSVSSLLHLLAQGKPQEGSRSSLTQALLDSKKSYVKSKPQKVLTAA